MDSRRIGKRFAFAAGRIHFFLSAAILIVSCVFLFGLLYGLWRLTSDVDWRRLWTDPELRAAAALTAVSTAVSTFAASGIGLGCAYALSRFTFFGKPAVETLLEFPIVLPPLVGGVLLLGFFGPLLGNRLDRLGLTVVFTPLGVVVAQTFIAAPFAVKMFREVFSSIDIRYEHIARTLGCTPREAFRRVILPLASRGIFAGVAMTWARTVGEFGATAMLAGVTRMKTETVSAAIFLSMSKGELDAAVAISAALLAVSFILLFMLKLGPLERFRREQR